MRFINNHQAQVFNLYHFIMQARDRLIVAIDRSSREDILRTVDALEEHRPEGVPHLYSAADLTKAEQAAERSKPHAFFAPRRSCTRHAVEGKNMSGVTVQTMMTST